MILSSFFRGDSGEVVLTRPTRLGQLSLWVVFQWMGCNKKDQTVITAFEKGCMKAGNSIEECQWLKASAS